MNTNAVLPVINRGRDHLLVTYTIGTGQVRQPHIVPADYQSLDSMEAVLNELIQHSYLMGVDEGVALDRLARQDGYGQGGQDHAESPWPLGSDLGMTWGEGLEARRRDNEAGSRIENLIGNARRGNEELAAANANWQQQVENLTNQLNECQEQRDVVAENHLVAQAEYDSLREQGRILLESRQRRIEELEGEVTGGLNALHEVSQQRDLYGQERDQARTDYANAGVIVEQLQNEMDQARRNWQEQLRVRDEEFESHAQNLLQEAIDRGWCADYETWTRQTNEGKRYYLFPARSKNYCVSVEVEMECDVSDYESDVAAIASDVDRTMIVTFHIDLQDIDPDDIETEVLAVRRNVESQAWCHRIQDVQWDESE